MSKVKGQGKSKNNRKTAGKRLGVKRNAGQRVRAGEVIVRQVGLSKRAGSGTYVSRNYSIHAAIDGTVQFQTKRVRLYTGLSVARTEVQVTPLK